MVHLRSVVVLCVLGSATFHSFSVLCHLGHKVREYDEYRLMSFETNTDAQDGCCFMSFHTYLETPFSIIV